MRSVSVVRVCCLVLSLIVVACAPKVEQVELFGETMGTTYAVKLIGGGIDGEGFRRRIETTLESINAQMSTWRPDSEISRFNRLRSTQWFTISDDFTKVLMAARKINRRTDGAFDVTLGELIDLWGFGAGARKSFPDPESIATALRHTGPAKFEVDEARKAIRKTDPETQIDLSGIAKGYAVDALAGVITDAGIENFLVEIGGEVRASGRRIDGSLWRVAVEKPDTGGRSVQLVVGLDNAAIATSGDYRKFFEMGGRRYSHIIDPETGSPSEHALASVSVTADDAMTADALATALMVMGVRKALALAARNEIPVFFIERKGDDYVVHSTDQFEMLRTDVTN